VSFNGATDKHIGSGLSLLLTFLPRNFERPAVNIIASSTRPLAVLTNDMRFFVDLVCQGEVSLIRGAPEETMKSDKPPKILLLEVGSFVGVDVTKSPCLLDAPTQMVAESG
jgi:hypothetical protein